MYIFIKKYSVTKSTSAWTFPEITKSFSRKRATPKDNSFCLFLSSVLLHGALPSNWPLCWQLELWKNTQATCKSRKSALRVYFSTRCVYATRERKRERGFSLLIEPRARAILPSNYPVSTFCSSCARCCCIRGTFFFCLHGRLALVCADCRGFSGLFAKKKVDRQKCRPGCKV